MPNPYPLLALILVFLLAGCAPSVASPAPTSVAPPTPAPATDILRYAGDAGLFPNPERGWIESVTPAGDHSQPLTLSRLLALRAGPDQVSLVRKYYLLSEYRRSRLPPDFLVALEQDFRAVRAAGFKLIPRFVYVWSVGANRLDAPLEVALGHIAQLRPVLAANVDALAFVEAGFVGRWGEWNESSSGYINNFTLQIRPSGLQLRDALLAAVPTERMVAVRYLYWHKMKFFPTPLDATTAFDPALPQARIGYHHDRVMSAEDWSTEGCGECPPYPTMRAYLEADNQWVVQSGEPETIADNPYPLINDPRPELRERHFSALVRNANDDESAPHYAAWRESGAYDDLTRLMGYRFRLLTAELPRAAHPGDLLRARLTLTNDGYAGIYNPRGVELVLRAQNGDQWVLPVDAGKGNRLLLPGPGVTTTLEISGTLAPTMPPDSYELFLNLPDPNPRLHGRPEYSIRLANRELWEPSSGFNRLRHMLTLVAGAPAPAPSGAAQPFRPAPAFVPDTRPPFPNPATWELPPTAVTTATVSMRAAATADVSGVEYFFSCASVGCRDSGWQASSEYLDNGLAAGGAYGYRVQTRDGAGNRTAWSAVLTATTKLVDDAAIAAPWASADIGGPTLPGSARIDSASGAWMLEASGADIWGEADQFSFVYRSLDGDGVILAKLTSLTSTHEWAKAGVMIRDGLDPGARQAAMFISAANGSSFQWRPLAGESMSAQDPRDDMTAPGWVRIERHGDKLTGAVSSDGIAWEEVYTTTIALPRSVLIGLCATSHTNGRLTTASFEQISVQKAGE